MANYGIGGQYNTHFDASGTIWPNAQTVQKVGNEVYTSVFGDRVRILAAMLFFIFGSICPPGEEILGLVDLRNRQLSQWNEASKLETWALRSSITS